MPIIYRPSSKRCGLQKSRARTLIARRRGVTRKNVVLALVGVAALALAGIVLVCVIPDGNKNPDDKKEEKPELPDYGLEAVAGLEAPAFAELYAAATGAAVLAPRDESVHAGGDELPPAHGLTPAARFLIHDLLRTLDPASDANAIVDLRHEGVWVEDRAEIIRKVAKAVLEYVKNSCDILEMPNRVEDWELAVAAAYTEKPQSFNSAERSLFLTLMREASAGGVAPDRFVMVYCSADRIFNTVLVRAADVIIARRDDKSQPLSPAARRAVAPSAPLAETEVLMFHAVAVIEFIDSVGLEPAAATQAYSGVLRASLGLEGDAELPDAEQLGLAVKRLALIAEPASSLVDWFEDDRRLAVRWGGQQWIARVPRHHRPGAAYAQMAEAGLLAESAIEGRVLVAPGSTAVQPTGPVRGINPPYIELLAADGQSRTGLVLLPPDSGSSESVRLSFSSQHLPGLDLSESQWRIAVAEPARVAELFAAGTPDQAMWANLLRHPEGDESPSGAVGLSDDGTVRWTSATGMAIRLVAVPLDLPPDADTAFPLPGDLPICALSFDAASNVEALSALRADWHDRLKAALPNAASVVVTGDHMLVQRAADGSETSPSNALFTATIGSDAVSIPAEAVSSTEGLGDLLEVCEERLGALRLVLEPVVGREGFQSLLSNELKDDPGRAQVAHWLLGVEREEREALVLAMREAAELGRVIASLTDAQGGSSADVALREVEAVFDLQADVPVAASVRLTEEARREKLALFDPDDLVAQALSLEAAGKRNHDEVRATASLYSSQSEALGFTLGDYNDAGELVPGSEGTIHDLARHLLASEGARVFIAAQKVYDIATEELEGLDGADALGHQLVALSDALKELDQALGALMRPEADTEGPALSALMELGRGFALHPEQENQAAFESVVTQLAAVVTALDSLRTSEAQSDAVAIVTAVLAREFSDFQGSKLFLHSVLGLASWDEFSARLSESIEAALSESAGFNGLLSVARGEPVYLRFPPTPDAGSDADPGPAMLLGVRLQTDALAPDRTAITARVYSSQGQFLYPGQRIELPAWDEAGLKVSIVIEDAGADGPRAIYLSGTGHANPEEIAQIVYQTILSNARIFRVEFEAPAYPGMDVPAGTWLARYSVTDGRLSLLGAWTPDGRDVRTWAEKQVRHWLGNPNYTEGSEWLNRADTPVQIDLLRHAGLRLRVEGPPISDLIQDAPMVLRVVLTGAEGQPARNDQARVHKVLDGRLGLVVETQAIDVLEGELAEIEEGLQDFLKQLRIDGVSYADGELRIPLPAIGTTEPTVLTIPLQPAETPVWNADPTAGMEQFTGLTEEGVAGRLTRSVSGTDVVVAATLFRLAEAKDGQPEQWGVLPNGGTLESLLSGQGRSPMTVTFTDGDGDAIELRLTPADWRFVSTQTVQQIGDGATPTGDYILALGGGGRVEAGLVVCLHPEPTYELWLRFELLHKQLGAVPVHVRVRGDDSGNVEVSTAVARATAHAIADASGRWLAGQVRRWSAGLSITDTDSAVKVTLYPDDDLSAEGGMMPKEGARLASLQATLQAPLGDAVVGVGLKASVYWEQGQLVPRFDDVAVTNPQALRQALSGLVDWLPDGWLNVAQSVADDVRVSYDEENGEHRLTVQFLGVLIGTTPLGLQVTDEGAWSLTDTSRQAIIDEIGKRVEEIGFSAWLEPVLTYDLEGHRLKAGFRPAGSPNESGDFSLVFTLKDKNRIEENPVELNSALNFQVSHRGVFGPGDGEARGLAREIGVHIAQTYANNLLDKLKSNLHLSLLGIDAALAGIPDGKLVLVDDVPGYVARFSLLIRGEVPGLTDLEELEIQVTNAWITDSLEIKLRDIQGVDASLQPDVKLNSPDPKRILEALFRDELAAFEAFVASETEGLAILLKEETFEVRGYDAVFTADAYLDPSKLKGFSLEGGPIPLGTITVAYRDGRMRFVGEEPDLIPFLASALNEELTGGALFEIVERKVFVDRVAAAGDALVFSARVVQDSDPPLVLNGKVSVNLRNGDVDFDLSLEESAIANLVSIVSSMIPDVGFVQVYGARYEENNAGWPAKHQHRGAVTFGFRADILGIGFDFDPGALWVGSDGLFFSENADPEVEFTLPIAIQLGTTPFMATRLSVRINLDTKEVGLGTVVTVTGYQFDRLVRMQGMLSTRLDRPERIDARGAAYVLAFPLGQTTADLWLDERLFRSDMSFGYDGVIQLTGSGEVRLPGGSAPWGLTAQQNLTIGDFSLADAAIRAGPDGFHAHARADIKIAHASVSFDSDLALRSPYLEASAGIDLKIASVELRIGAGLKGIHVYARADAGLVEVVIQFDLPSWAELTPELLIHKIREALSPTGFSVSGNPLDFLTSPGMPKLTLNGGDIDIDFGGSGGGNDGDGSDSEGRGELGGTGAPTDAGEASRQAGQQTANHAGRAAVAAAQAAANPAAGSGTDSAEHHAEAAMSQAEQSQAALQSAGDATGADASRVRQEALRGAAQSAESLGRMARALDQAATQLGAQGEQLRAAADRAEQTRSALQEDIAEQEVALRREVTQRHAQRVEDEREQMREAMERQDRAQQAEAHAQQTQAPADPRQNVTPPAVERFVSPDGSGGARPQIDPDLVRNTARKRLAREGAGEERLEVGSTPPGDQILTLGAVLIQQMEAGKELNEILPDPAGEPDEKHPFAAFLHENVGVHEVSGYGNVLRLEGHTVYEQAFAVIVLCEIQRHRKLTPLRASNNERWLFRSNPPEPFTNALDAIRDNLSIPAEAYSDESRLMTKPIDLLIAGLMRGLAAYQSRGGGWSYNLEETSGQSNPGDMSITQAAMYAMHHITSLRQTGNAPYAHTPIMLYAFAQAQDWSNTANLDDPAGQLPALQLSAWERYIRVIMLGRNFAKSCTSHSDLGVWYHQDRSGENPNFSGGGAICFASPSLHSLNGAQRQAVERLLEAEANRLGLDGIDLGIYRQYLLVGLNRSLDQIASDGDTISTEERYHLLYLARGALAIYDAGDPRNPKLAEALGHALDLLNTSADEHYRLGERDWENVVKETGHRALGVLAHDAVLQAYDLYYTD